MRNVVFSAIADDLASLAAFSVVLQKSRLRPALRDPGRLYPRCVEWLMKFALHRIVKTQTRSLVVITDSLPVSRRRREVEKAVKRSVNINLPRSIDHHIFHHQSRADLNLQIVDYVNWAVYRKWERGDTRSYDLIAGALRGELDVFRRGTTDYY